MDFRDTDFQESTVYAKKDIQDFMITGIYEKFEKNIIYFYHEVSHIRMKLR